MPPLSSSAPNITFSSELACKNRLLERRPITREEIKGFYTEFCQKPQAAGLKTSDFLFDRSHTLISLIERLYRAVFFGREAECPFSTTGGVRIFDNETNETLMYSKGQMLSESLGVPLDEAIQRERLYYLLDNNGFAGVPPTLSIKLSTIKVRSFQWFKEGCEWSSNLSLLQAKASMRKCFIHQFRTVNMDPSVRNVLIPMENQSSAFPIDGGYSLPTFFSDDRRLFAGTDNRKLLEKPSFEDPFNDEELSYLKGIDIESDKKLIKNHLKNCDEVESVLSIFQTANLILKKAGERFKKEEINQPCISLQDLYIIRESRPAYNEPGTSLFDYILEPFEIGDLETRIESVFDEIIKLKMAILANQSETPEALTLKMWKSVGIKNLAMRRVVAHYVLGVDGIHLCKGAIRFELNKIK